MKVSHHVRAQNLLDRRKRHQKSGLLIAKRLAEHDSVTRVHHPGLSPCDYSSLKGYGGLFSFELADAVDIPTFCDALSLFRLGVSWGGYESLVMPAEVSINQAGDYNAAIDFGVSPRTIRLFIGLENPEELWNDLMRAFSGA